MIGVIAMAQVNVRIDDTIKQNAEMVCKALGLSLSTAVTMYLTQIAREQRIPLDMSLDPFYSEENMRRLRASIAQMESTDCLYSRR